MAPSPKTNIIVVNNDVDGSSSTANHQPWSTKATQVVKTASPVFLRTSWSKGEGGGNKSSLLKKEESFCTEPTILSLSDADSETEDSASTASNNQEEDDGRLCFLMTTVEEETARLKQRVTATSNRKEEEMAWLLPSKISSTTRSLYACSPSPPSSSFVIQKKNGNCTPLLQPHPRLLQQQQKRHGSAVESSCSFENSPRSVIHFLQEEDFITSPHNKKKRGLVLAPTIDIVLNSFWSSYQKDDVIIATNSNHWRDERSVAKHAKRNLETNCNEYTTCTEKKKKNVSSSLQDREHSTHTLQDPSSSLQDFEQEVDNMFERAMEELCGDEEAHANENVVPVGQLMKSIVWQSQEEELLQEEHDEDDENVAFLQDLIYND